MDNYGSLHRIVAKSSVDFILNPFHEQSQGEVIGSLEYLLGGRRPAQLELVEPSQSPCLAVPTSVTHRNKCSVEECTTAAVSKGRCVRHGGGTRCSVAGCTKRTKRFNRCYLHGGFVLCSTEGCSSKAKRYGRCWAHGGGAQCSEESCSKLVAKGGLCWSHGGGMHLWNPMHIQCALIL
ncbi:hypothetical protein, variant [Aphanomyces astaci]|uniref:WRKY19-like zinc finger domain-containing protein n=1 Tax=Aphanomyces astaci TaxID=112090 RepID=W4FGZ9_APHAT|nr:hypothetical protein, variant [Aphanomyces astaci]ETV66725.1 hypothetical protein, variant [Aphanomyces astaci]|eukprot:XP_009843701.1 hypothetical protein, variant [Aphanomyces astaci]